MSAPDVLREPRVVTKAREHCASFAHPDDSSAVFQYEGDGTVWRVSGLLQAYDAMAARIAEQAAEIERLRDVEKWSRWAYHNGVIDGMSEDDA